MPDPESVPPKTETAARTATKADEPGVTGLEASRPATGQETASIGRVYDRDALMPVILERLTKGESVRQIARSEGMPEEFAIRQWGQTDAWQSQYARAREAGWESMGDEILDIADDGRNDWMDREERDGRVVRVKDHEAIERSRIRLDTRKWLLSKMLPKVYGDRLEVTGGLALLVAFNDLRPAPAPLDVEADSLPHIEAPDGKVG